MARKKKENVENKTTVSTKSIGCATFLSNSFCSSSERVCSSDCCTAPTLGEALSIGVDVADVWISYLTSSSFDWINPNSLSND